MELTDDIYEMDEAERQFQDDMGFLNARFKIDAYEEVTRKAIHIEQRYLERIANFPDRVMRTQIARHRTLRCLATAAAEMNQPLSEVARIVQAWEQEVGFGWVQARLQAAYCLSKAAAREGRTEEVLPFIAALRPLIGTDNSVCDSELKTRMDSIARFIPGVWDK